MPESHLPEDLAAWPDDPFSLLGVEPSAAAAELRRAYNRLVRLYRPDDRPKEFQKVREAYERATRILQWRQFDDPEASPSDDADSSPTDTGPAEPIRRPAPPAVPLEPLEISSRTPANTMANAAGTFAQRLDVAWSVGRDGDAEGCLQRLKELQQERPEDPEPYLRLYWLHRLIPELAARTAAVDWLTEGLFATRLSPRLMPAYADELRHSALSLLEERAGRLMTVEASDERLVELARARWTALARLHEWTQIDLDLDILRPRLSIDAPDDWIRLQFLAIDHAIWSELLSGRRLVERCQRELKEFPDRELALADEYERLGLLLEMVSDPYLNGGQGVPEGLRQLLRKSWNASDGELRFDFLELVAGWIEAPVAALQVATDLAIHSQVGFLHLWRTVHRARVDWQMQPSEERLAKLSARIEFFLSQVVGLSYGQWRDDLLEFCLNELIWPEEIAEMISTKLRHFHREELASEIQQDVPLRCLFRACMAFFSEAG